MGTTAKESFDEAERVFNSCAKALEPPKHRPLSPDAQDILKRATFALESIAHMCGWEAELLETVKHLKRLRREAGQDERDQ